MNAACQLGPSPGQMLALAPVFFRQAGTPSAKLKYPEFPFCRLKPHNPLARNPCIGHRTLSPPFAGSWESPRGFGNEPEGVRSLPENLRIRKRSGAKGQQGLSLEQAERCRSLFGVVICADTHLMACVFEAWTPCPKACWKSLRPEQNRLRKHLWCVQLHNCVYISKVNKHTKYLYLSWWIQSYIFSTCCPLCVFHLFPFSEGFSLSLRCRHPWRCWPCAAGMDHCRSCGWTWFGAAFREGSKGGFQRDPEGSLWG